jgi:hypothetical protein
MKKVNKRKAETMNPTEKTKAKRKPKPVDSANEKLVETIAERGGVSKRQARKLAFDADQRIAEALGVGILDVQRARGDAASSEDRRDWAAEDKHDLKKEGGWDP